MRIAILGGRFDPPHLGHLLVAQQIKEKLFFDEVWFMPVYQYNPLFGKKMSPFRQRLTMTKLLKNSYIKISDFEIKKRGTSYTIDTFNLLKEKYLKNIFYWIIGSDQLSAFHKWKNWQTLIKNHNIIIFPRGNGKDDLQTRVKKTFGLKNLPKNITILDSKNLIISNISSTAIRERIKKGLSIAYFVPKEVERYINKNKLYKHD